MSECVAKHFFGTKGLRDEKFNELIETIGDYGTYHPSSILVVVIENACGPFN